MLRSAFCISFITTRSPITRGGDDPLTRAQNWQAPPMVDQSPAQQVAARLWADEARASGAAADEQPAAGRSRCVLAASLHAGAIMEFATLNPRILAAFTPFTSREETRYYLQGVLVEITAESVIYAATDGHRLAASYAAVKEPNTLLGNYIIPTRACGKWSKRLPDNARLTREGDKTLRLTSAHDDPVIFEPIDGHFPYWRRIVPDFLPPVEAQFNWQYLADFHDLGERLKLGQARVRASGENPAIVTFSSDGDTFGVVMPMRTSHPPPGAPSWAKLPKQEAA